MLGRGSAQKRWASAIAVAYGVRLLAGGRKEIVRVLRGRPSGERYRKFDLRAGAITGTVMLSTQVGGFS
jgi:hypothetical protein